MIALAPRAVQNMPERFRRDPITVLQRPSSRSTCSRKSSPGWIRSTALPPGVRTAPSRDSRWAAGNLPTSGSVTWNCSAPSACSVPPAARITAARHKARFGDPKGDQRQARRLLDRHRQRRSRLPTREAVLQDADQSPDPQHVPRDRRGSRVVRVALVPHRVRAASVPALSEFLATFPLKIRIAVSDPVGYPRNICPDRPTFEGSVDVERRRFRNLFEVRSGREKCIAGRGSFTESVLARPGEFRCG